MKTKKGLHLGLQFFAVPNSNAERLKEIESRLSAIRAEVDTENADLTALQEETTKLIEERKKLQDTAEQRHKLLGDLATSTVTAPEIRGFIGLEGAAVDTPPSGESILSSAEYRSAFLHRLQGRELTETEKRTMTSASESVGAAIPTQTLNTIIEKMRQTSALYPLISISAIPSNLSIPRENTSGDASWVAENAESTDTDETLSALTLSAYKLIRTIEITAQVESMAIDAFESFIGARMAQKLAVALENAIINGTGNAQPTGIIKGITWDKNNSITVPAAQSVTYDDICNALALLPSMYHQGARFICNRKFLFDVLAKIKDADERPIFVNNATAKVPMSVLGHEVVLDDYVQDNTVIIGDPSYYMMNFSRQIEITSDTSAGFRTGTTVYRGMALVDGNVIQPEAFVKISKVEVGG